MGNPNRTSIILAASRSEGGGWLEASRNETTKHEHEVSNVDLSVKVKGLVSAA